MHVVYQKRQKIINKLPVLVEGPGNPQLTLLAFLDNALMSQTQTPTPAPPLPPPAAAQFGVLLTNPIISEPSFEFKSACTCAFMFPALDLFCLFSFFGKKEPPPKIMSFPCLSHHLLLREQCQSMPELCLSASSAGHGLAQGIRWCSLRKQRPLLPQAGT